MLVTPVVYVIPPEGFLMRLNVYNPLYYLVNVPRALLFSGTFGHPAGFLISSVVALVVFIMGWRFYHLAMGRIVEKV